MINLSLLYKAQFAFTITAMQTCCCRVQRETFVDTATSRFISDLHSAGVVPTIFLSMTRFNGCIDLHNGKVKQIVGGSLSDKAPEDLKTNFVATYVRSKKHCIEQHGLTAHVYTTVNHLHTMQIYTRRTRSHAVT